MFKYRLHGAAAALLFGSTLAASAAPILTGSFTADNYVFVYLSTSATTLGTLLGSGSNWGSVSTLTSTTLTPGTTYYLNVEAINGDSGAYSSGGFLGQFSVTGGEVFANGAATILTGTSGWFGSYNNSNSSATAQAWVRPTGSVVSLGANGVGPWGTLSGISTSAQWIWPTDAVAPGTSSPGNQCAACTVDFQTTISVASVPEPATAGLFLLGLAGLGAALRRRNSPAA